MARSQIGQQIRMFRPLLTGLLQKLNSLGWTALNSKFIRLRTLPVNLLWFSHLCVALPFENGVSDNTPSPDDTTKLCMTVRKSKKNMPAGPTSYPSSKCNPSSLISSTRGMRNPSISAKISEDLALSFSSEGDDFLLEIGHEMQPSFIRHRLPHFVRQPAAPSGELGPLRERPDRRSPAGLKPN